MDKFVVKSKRIKTDDEQESIRLDDSKPTTS